MSRDYVAMETQLKTPATSATNHVSNLQKLFVAYFGRYKENLIQPNSVCEPGHGPELRSSERRQSASFTSETQPQPVDERRLVAMTLH